MSTTYRKASYRQVIAPHAHDLTYLRHTAKQHQKFYRQYTQIHSAELHVVKYEHVRDDTPGEMARLLQWADLEVSEEALAACLYQHSADNMRSGLVPVQGNLDEGGMAQSWREMMTDKEQRMIKPFVQEALEAFGYEHSADW